MNNALIKSFCLSLLVTLSLLSFSTTAITLSNLFQDNMIIQRDKPFLISGSAAPSTPVTVTLDKSEWKGMSNLQGYWEVNLPAQAVGGPHVIKVTSQKKEKEISNIYFGDVWIASGQSNMEWKLSWSTDNWEDESLQANLPLIRFLEVKNTISPTPKTTLTLEKKWLSATPNTVKDFSAIAWYFAKAIHLDTDVPIGIIDSAWGGTPIEAWTPNSIVKNLPHEYPNTTYLDKDNWQNKVQLSDNNNKRRQQQLHNEKAFKELQTGSEQYDDSTWQLTSLPGEYQGDNIVWMRKKLYLSNISIKEPSLLSFGLYPNYFEVFINNKRIFKRAAHRR
ncbi:hypothetical protein L3081_20950 [Colwellia sp. MSW7]|uniref:Sialate O-acetylesterase domain-containing protein n=1 Tax=Colwellia maritima TaxID=2912588 RepID=A0ABS9X571_9GAMM|nr:sialate O-acetylesterase [Colwellia maritima]MCI2285400.1 hypothetical protein [Colwellia maritima]